MLLHKFNKYPTATAFTVEEIINASNEVYDNILIIDNVKHNIKINSKQQEAPETEPKNKKVHQTKSGRR